MNSKEAVKKIMEVLGLKSQYFYESKTDQGLKMTMEGDLQVGSPIYVATDEGMIPAPDGTHKLEDGTSLEVTEGKVSKIDMGGMTDEITDDAEREKVQHGDTIETMAESTEQKVSKEEGDIELADGTILRPGRNPVMAGVKIKKVIYDGSTSAIADGEYEMTDGDILSIVGGEVKGVKSAEARKKEAGFTEAMTPDGIKLSSPSFDKGEKLEVVKEDGTIEPAPDGTHQVTLKDTEGKEINVVVTSKDGIIDEREDAEVMENDIIPVEALSAITDAFKQALEKFESKLDEISNKQKELETKFGKFSNEPAGSRIIKTQITKDSNPINTRYEGFRRLKESLTQN